LFSRWLKDKLHAMTRPFESDPLTVDTWGIASTEAEVVGLLRRAARGLACLEEFPTYPGEALRLAAASHAVRRALVELEALC